MTLSWRFVFETKSPGWDITKVSNVAFAAGFPFFSFDKVIYQFCRSEGKEKDVPGPMLNIYEPSDIAPGDLDHCEAFCIMDKKCERFFMENKIPVILPTPTLAAFVASQINGIVLTWSDANKLLAKKRAAGEEPSRLILPQ